MVVFRKEGEFHECNNTLRKRTSDLYNLNQKAEKPVEADIDA